MADKLMIKCFSDFITDKTVALVGPAQTIIGSKLGNKINSYDTVCRIGNDIGITEEEKPDVGDRTDVLYENFWSWKEEYIKYLPTQAIISEYLYEELHVRIIRSYISGVQSFISANNNRVPWSASSIEIEKRLRKAIGICPTKGPLAIADILELCPKELFICGITFNRLCGWKDSYMNNPFYPIPALNAYKEGDYTIGVSDIEEGHDKMLELSWFHKKITECPCITMDAVLNWIVDVYGSQN